MRRLSCMENRVLHALFVLLVLSGELVAQVRRPVAATLPALPPGTKVQRDLPYVKGGGNAQSLDLFVPKTDKPLPLVIWIHGGGWIHGDKSNNPGIPLLSLGYAV